MRHFLITGLVVTSLVGIAYAQVVPLTPLTGIPAPNGVGFSRIVTAAPGHGRSAYQGRADTVELGGKVTTYRGNVSVAFPDSNIRVTADQAVLNGNEMEFSGNVRLVLNSPSAQP